MESTESIVLSPKLKSTNTSAVLSKEPNEVYLSLFRFIARLEKGSNAQDANLYNYVDSIVDIAKQDSFQPLGTTAKGARLTVAATRMYIHLVAAALRQNGKNVVVKHDHSEYVNGEYHKAKRGGKILGITFDPLKDAEIDAIKAGRLELADPVALSLPEKGSK